MIGGPFILKVLDALLSHILKNFLLANFFGWASSGFDIVAGFVEICAAKILEDELEELDEGHSGTFWQPTTLPVIGYYLLIDL